MYVAYAFSRCEPCMVSPLGDLDENFMAFHDRNGWSCGGPQTQCNSWAPHTRLFGSCKRVVSHLGFMLNLDRRVLKVIVTHVEEN